MVPYIFYISVLVVAAFRDLFNRTANNRVLVGFIFIFFVLLVGFTDGNGLDWRDTINGEGYSELDYRALGLDGVKKFEPGFMLLNIILGDFRLFLIFMSISCFLLIWSVINHGSSYKLIALFVYLCSMTLYCYMGVYRHALALTIVIYSWKYIDDKRKLFLCILLACTFHYSAAIAFLYILLFRLSIVSLKRWAIIGGIGLLIQPYILPLIISISPFLPGETAGKILLYMNSDDFGSGISYKLLMLKCVIFLFAYYNINKDNQKQCFLLNSYGLSIILFIVITFSPTFARLVDYFSCTDILLIPFTMENLIKKTKRYGRTFTMVPLLYFLLVISTYVYSFFNMLDKFDHIYIPYKSILF